MPGKQRLSMSMGIIVGIIVATIVYYIIINDEVSRTVVCTSQMFASASASMRMKLIS